MRTGHWGLLTVVVASSLVGGCHRESRRSEPLPDVQIAEPMVARLAHPILSVRKVYADGEHVGYVKVKDVGTPENGRIVNLVYDHVFKLKGFVGESGRTYLLEGDTLQDRGHHDERKAVRILLDVDLDANFTYEKMDRPRDIDSDDG
jgi:hypothetical protein